MVKFVMLVISQEYKSRLRAAGGAEAIILSSEKGRSLGSALKALPETEGGQQLNSVTLSFFSVSKPSCLCCPSSDVVSDTVLSESRTDGLESAHIQLSHRAACFGVCFVCVRPMQLKFYRFFVFCLWEQFLGFSLAPV